MLKKNENQARIISKESFKYIYQYIYERDLYDKPKI